jgi:branched-chain amino acid transport system permease protein
MRMSALGMRLGPLLVLAVGALAPAILTSGFRLRLAMLIWIYAILNMGFNLLYGFAGQISLGQQAFFAIGAYGLAMLQVKAQLPLWLAMPGGVLICAAVALVIGLPVLRLRVHYLAMATLSFGLILSGVANRWIDFTGGTAGLQIPPVTIGGDPLTRVQMYYVVFAVAFGTFLVHDFMIRSHLGRALQAIRDDETGASALGINVTRYKLRTFVLAAVFAGMAGVCFTLVNLRVDPSLMDFRVLVSILTIAVVGGLGTRFGPILGAILVIVLPQTLTQFGELETLVYGICVLLFLLFLPRGLAGLIESGTWRQRLRGTRGYAPAEQAAADSRERR